MHVDRSGAVYSLLHSTISILSGITSYQNNGYQNRVYDLQEVRKTIVEFILQHQLFLSDKAGAKVKKEFLKLTYPYRWRYNILRALDYFQYAIVPWDERMKPAILVLLQKRNKNCTWNVQAKHPGQVHFTMDKAGQPNRSNTLRALPTLQYYNFMN